LLSSKLIYESFADVKCIVYFALFRHVVTTNATTATAAVATDDDDDVYTFDVFIRFNFEISSYS